MILYYDIVAQEIIQISPSQAVIHKIACSTYGNKSHGILQNSSDSMIAVPV